MAGLFELAHGVLPPNAQRGVILDLPPHGIPQAIDRRTHTGDLILRRLDVRLLGGKPLSERVHAIVDLLDQNPEPVDGHVQSVERRLALHGSALL